MFTPISSFLWKLFPNKISVNVKFLRKTHWSTFRWAPKGKQVAQRATIAHLSPMCQGQNSFQKIQTHPSFNACSCYMKVSKGSNQKQQRKSGNTIFPIIRSIGVLLRRSRAANSVVGGPTGRNSNSFIILCMSLLPACLKKIGSISTEITWWHRFFRHSRAANSEVSGGICLKFKLI